MNKNNDVKAKKITIFVLFRWLVRTFFILNTRADCKVYSENNIIFLKPRKVYNVNY